MRDDEAMRRAVALAETVRRSTAPNPWVGCLILSDGEVVGEGATQPPGGDHAEVVALRRAGGRSRGATAVVSLEPCAHHGRTAPCADALIEAGVTRVAIALLDPDSRVAGEGAARLRAAGVEVSVGAMEREARHSLAPYLHHRRTGRAFCVVKAATSLDGRVAAADGTSRWITGPEARADAHGLRADSQAVVVGAGTALADRPALTVRDAEIIPSQQPLRVLLDASGRVPAEGPLFDTGESPTLVVTTERAPAPAVEGWRRTGAGVVVVPEAAGGVDLSAALAVLGDRGVLQALVEGGPTLHGAILDAGLAGRVVAYVAATVLGSRGMAAYGVAGPETIAEAARLRLLDVRRLGDDVRLDYEPPGDGEATTAAPARQAEKAASGREAEMTVSEGEA